MKMRHDMVTGIVGLLTCIFFFIMTQQVRQPANLAVFSSHRPMTEL